jgi:hypothetical protein
MGFGKVLVCLWLDEAIQNLAIVGTAPYHGDRSPEGEN